MFSARSCLRRLKFSTEPSAVNPAGSQNPTGSCTPSSFSKARKGRRGVVGPVTPGASGQAVLTKAALMSIDD